MTTRPQAAAWASALVAVVGDDDALAGGEAVVLDDVRRPERVERRGRLLGRCVQTWAAAVGTPAAAITSLANALEPSSCGGLPGRAEAGDARGADGVGDPRDQRRLGPDDDEVGARARRPGAATASPSSGSTGVQRRRPRRCRGCRARRAPR